MTSRKTSVVAGATGLILSAVLTTLAVADEPAAPTDCAPYTFYFPVGQMIVMEYWPSHSKNASGTVVIECTVQEKGWLKCEILHENPEGYGFGTATVRLFQDHARVRTKTPGGKICPGGKHRYTYRWIQK